VLIFLIIALTGISPNQAEFHNGEVSICVDIHSNIYKYNVTDLATSPIVEFEIRPHASYNFIVPEGWQNETSRGVFRAWSSSSQKAIYPNQSADFSVRVSSTGAVLGRIPVTVHLADGRTSTVAGVWAPTPEPRSYIALVAGLLIAIMVIHTAILTYRERARRKNL
jgi:hypothetical protein